MNVRHLRSKALDEAAEPFLEQPTILSWVCENHVFTEKKLKKNHVLVHDDAYCFIKFCRNKMASGFFFWGHPWHTASLEVIRKPWNAWHIGHKHKVFPGFKDPRGKSAAGGAAFHGCLRVF